MIDDDPEITHDQIVARIQAYYNFLRQNYDELRVAKDCPTDDEETRKVIMAEYRQVDEHLELYSHTFEKILYTWLQ
jgi:hypothetical protein